MKTITRLFIVVGVLGLSAARVYAVSERERLARELPESRSQSMDDRELVTPHVPGGTNDRMPELRLSQVAGMFGFGSAATVRTEGAGERRIEVPRSPRYRTQITSGRER